MLNLNLSEDKFLVDIGQADIYNGVQYQYPYFFEHAGHRMMKNMSEQTIDFKTWKGEFFQCSLDKFHGKTCLVITSTLEDCVFLQARRLSIEQSKIWAKERSEKKSEVKGSFSGYYTYGKKLLKQYEDFEQHTAEQNICFSDEVLSKIFKELLRRAKYE